MTALVLAMLRARWRPAVALFVLAALASAGVALAPRYLDRTEEGLIADQVAAARPDERSMVAAQTVERNDVGDMDGRFERDGARLLDAPGFSLVFSASFTAQPADRPAVFLDGTRTVAYRDDVCAHVRLVAGRCLMSQGDAVVTGETARRLAVQLGDPLSLSASAYDSQSSRFVAEGSPGYLTVVGIVQPVAAAYWGRSSAEGTVFVDRRTFDGFGRRSELETIDAYPQDGAVRAATLPRLRAWLDRRAAEGGDPQVTIGLVGLLDRIDAARAAARAPVPFAAAPVALLGCAVLLFAVATGARVNRFEHGIVALRGARRTSRWVLAVAEPALPVLAGGLVGSLAGAGGVPSALQYGIALAAAAVLAAAVVAVRSVSAPLSDMLRRVDRRGARWRSATSEILAGLLAVVAVVHFHTSGDTVYGVAPLTPALLMLVAALLAARALPIVAARVAGAALHRGRPVTALAALRLARQPAGRRLLIVLVVAVALLGFATTGVTVAAATQNARADVAVGAGRVLSVAPVTRQRLLAATRAADPAGRYAMAVVALPDLLAVDAPRLSTVAIWPAGAADRAPADVAGALHPIAAAALAVLRGATVSFDITVTRLDELSPELVAFLAPQDGTKGLEVRLGRLQPGRHTYSGAAACTAGCRLAGLGLDLPRTSGPTVALTLHDPPTRDWRTPPGGSVTAAADGVAFTVQAGGRADAGLLQPAGIPERIPVLPTGPLPPDGLLGSLDSTPIPVAAVGAAHTLPRLGGHGTLVDLEYADRLARDSGVTDAAEVWLTPDTPQSIVDALTAGGLTVTGERTVEGERALRNRSGGALGMRFSLLAGVAAVLLGAAGLVATALGVNRADLSALRRQGVPARVTRRVEPAATLALVAVALVAGTLAAAVAWLAIGRYLPAVDPDMAPAPAPLGLALGAAAAVLCVSAWLRQRLAAG
ncbi:hypothetical protein [Dactylosporangium matsuzakiense]|uniref:FtsX-like permease family protein n=1 Tax=Dactylosporangium matsuzakiense TaxID=53360 RepID=A0A9W6KWG0_9ACTN|nr:hypothetical protein [Dactylosporangium matsuzakiense]UWZ40898.1 hypothetical protein Dmats_24500 [Dactylosporangium matsuzakiense]GLL08568.1 hypothetical protein GCM10017581_103350 [Dactylosporangium matsuzakiense]